MHVLPQCIITAQPLRAPSLGRYPARLPVSSHPPSRRMRHDQALCAPQPVRRELGARGRLPLPQRYESQRRGPPGRPARPMKPSMSSIVSKQRSSIASSEGRKPYWRVGRAHNQTTLRASKVIGTREACHTISHTVHQILNRVWSSTDLTMLTQRDSRHQAARKGVDTCTPLDTARFRPLHSIHALCRCLNSCAGAGSWAVTSRCHGQG
jgi:hypothetical protein